jgi:hypothetical protein
MLDLDPTTLTAVVNSAKLTAANDRRWLRAIDKAAEQLETNPYVEALDDHTLLIGSPSGQTYTANGSCQCVAFQQGQPCYHRAAARLYQRYVESQARQSSRSSYEQAIAAMDELFA